MNRYLLTILSVLLSALTFSTNAADHIKWNASVVEYSKTAGQIILTASVTPGFHFYAFPPDGGINALEIKTITSEGVELKDIATSVEPKKEFSAAMNETLSWWGEDVEFTIPYTLKDVDGALFKVNIRYQYCNDTQCYAPKRESFDMSVGNTQGLALMEAATSGKVSTSINNQSLNSWWNPVVTVSPSADKSPWTILILGFLGGLAALLTPCVWPMIPMTLSFFLKKGKATSKSKRDALTYGLSIITIYLVLGLFITIIFGAGQLNELSTSAVFNIIFFLLLVVFAISFFGAFDIKLPSKWANAMDSKAENTTGVLSIFFMAFTLALVSFSCTGPIIGTLLVEAASDGNMIGPALGFAGFAFGLALPFSLFSLFPTMLKSLPKSGGWLNTVKVVLGFIELILSLKFLSVADMAYGWHILDREVFVSLWIVLFVLLGLYLLGKLRFVHDDPQQHTGITRFFLAIFSFAFAVYLLPGLWGAPLKAVSAFVPPIQTQDFNLYVHDTKYVEFEDYDAGMEYAKQHNMPVLLDFSGWGCVNCRNMEAEVFDTDEVRAKLAENFVVIKLYVDDRESLASPITINDNGKDITIETLGEKWTYLQTHKFGANSQPFYIVLDNNGLPMTQPVYYDNNINRFINWLEDGIKNYNKELYYAK